MSWLLLFAPANAINYLSYGLRPITLQRIFTGLWLSLYFPAARRRWMGYGGVRGRLYASHFKSSVCNRGRVHGYRFALQARNPTWVVSKQANDSRMITLHVHVRVRPCICNTLRSKILILLAKWRHVWEVGPFGSSPQLKGPFEGEDMVLWLRLEPGLGQGERVS